MIMAKPWKCIMCKTINDPSDETRGDVGPNICANPSCRRWRYLIHSIAGGLLLALIGVGFGVRAMAKYPENTYRSRFSELYKNDVLGEGGLEITAEENEQ